jgi:D-beta-D-heptose 7-phosphate kinase/D-beta-D-heptose 1-phosphate adenosyltransferase
MANPVVPAVLSVPVAREPILVVGDIICDHYVHGEVDRISPEAPVQVLRWKSEINCPGGAANVALNLAALGCRPVLVGVVGRDAAGDWLIGALRATGVDTRGVIQAADRPTTTKTRIVARGQHLLRIDQETSQQVNPRDERRLVASIQRAAARVSGVVCSDYGKGVLTRSVLAAVLGRGGRGRKDRIVLVDPKGRDFSRYRGADLLTPNEKELVEAVPLEASRNDGKAALELRAEMLVRRLGLKALLVTRGADGMDLFEGGPAARGGLRRSHIPVSQRHEVYDVTGAGDTVAAVMTMAASAGMSLLDGARLANSAAGIVVASVGTAVTDRETLASVINGEASQARSKVVSQAALVSRLADRRAHGARIVFTNGCFDLLHVGHLHLLQRARALGDLLVVAINDDASTARLKGPGRPLIPGAQRAEMLAALRFVDYVTLFSEPTPIRVIRAVRPDVLAKGGDYTLDQIVGRNVVERYGGRVVVIPLVPGLSTSKLVETIRERGAP